MSHPHLLREGRIGPLRLRNRIVMTPMGSNLAREDGHASDALRAHYERRAQGGAGLVIVGVAAVAFPAGACNPRQVAISDDVYVPGLRTLTDAVHAHGARIAVQLQHAGKVATRDIAAGRPLWVPSATSLAAGDLFADLSPAELEAATGAYRQPGAGVRFHELDEADIAYTIEAFAAAAQRAVEAGFDAIELHAGHGYLLASFLSPLSNQRDDRWGGDVEARSRLLCEVVRAVRARIGSEVALWCRLDGAELGRPGGITPAAARRTAEFAIAAGADAIHVSAYADPSRGRAFTDAPLVHEPGGLLPLVDEIRAAVSQPLIAVGRIDPDLGDALIRDGRADFIAMGRRLLADPDLPRKLAAERGAEIRPCVYGYGCVGNIFLNAPLRCAVNPDVGRVPTRAASAAGRAAAIVGAGPAGLEAARLAAERGFEVHLFERAEHTGGRARAWARLDAPLAAWLDWIEAELQRLGVRLHLGRAVAPDAPVSGLAEDALWVDARGAGPAKLPALPGVTVAGADDVERWLAGPPTPGARVLVRGGDATALRLARFAARAGTRVTVSAPDAWLGAGLAPPLRWRILHDLAELGVELQRGVEASALDASGYDRVCFPSALAPRGRSRPLAPGARPIGDARSCEGFDAALADAAAWAERA